jgi:hypothetical protein
MIGVDTNILIWGLDRTTTGGIEHMVPLAERFFAYVSTQRIEVVIPSQVLAEFLVRSTDDERQEALALIDPTFPIAPLDFPAAMYAAELTSNRNHIEEVRATFGLKRQVVKADVNIIASLLAFGAERLVSGNEREMRALAQGKLLVQSLEEYVAKEIDRPDEPIRPHGPQLSLLPEETPQSGIEPERPEAGEA